MDVGTPGRNLVFLHEVQAVPRHPSIQKPPTPRLQPPQSKSNSSYIAKSNVDYERVRLGIRDSLRSQLIFADSARVVPVEVSGRLAGGRGDGPARTYPPPRHPPRGGGHPAWRALPVLDRAASPALRVRPLTHVFLSHAAGSLARARVETARRRPSEAPAAAPLLKGGLGQGDRAKAGAPTHAKHELAHLPQRVGGRIGGEGRGVGVGPASDPPRGPDDGHLSRSPSLSGLEPPTLLEEGARGSRSPSVSTPPRQRSFEKELSCLGRALWVPLETTGEQKVSPASPKMNQERAISRATLDTPQSPILSTSEKPRNSIMGISGTTSFSASALPQRKATSRFKEKTLCREKNSDDVGSTKARGLMRKRSFQSATTRAPGTARSRDVTPTKRTSPPKPKFQKLYGGSSPRQGRCATAGVSRRPYSAAGIGAARPPQVTDGQLRKRKEDLRRELYAWNRALEQKEGDSDAV